jgi:hypothetical protein
VFGPGRLAQRIQAVAHGSVGALPQALRARAAAQYDTGNMARLTEVMTAWSSGARLSNVEFADRFFGRTADDPIVEKLHDEAVDVGSATSHAKLRDAAEKIANAMQAIGLDRWPRFLADARDRARAPAAVTAIAKSVQPQESREIGIRPVYPVETLMGIGAAGIVGGIAGAARAVGGAVLRQILPANRPAAGNIPKVPHNEVRPLKRLRIRPRQLASKPSRRQAVSPFDCVRVNKENTSKGRTPTFRRAAP